MYMQLISIVFKGLQLYFNPVRCQKPLGRCQKPLGRCQKPLGRWQFHNNSQTALKIKYANEDNCGTCELEKDINVQELDNLYIYMMGSESLPDVKN
jgi:hypothetical protein